MKPPKKKPHGSDPGAALAPIQLVLSKLQGVRKCGKGLQARCPAHDDKRASLSLTVNDDGDVLLYCHAGCPAETVLDAMGLTFADLFAPNRGRRIAATYDYRDEKHHLLFQIVRYEPKDFRQRRPDGRSGWAWNMKGVRRVLYRLPQLQAADSNAWVFITEGEKDANAFACHGLVATTNPGGAGKWKHVEDASLVGRHVAIIPDADEAGRKHALDVANRLCRRAADVRIVELPGVPDKGDVSDWLAAGHSPEELLELVKHTPSFVKEEMNVNNNPQPEGAKSPPTPRPLDYVRPIFEKWLAGLDPDLLDVVFGAFLAHRIEGDPLWLLVVAAPGDTKTEILRCLFPAEDAYELSSLTPQALLSGWNQGDGSDPSLLPKLDGKVVIMKDFTTILSMSSDALKEVVGTLRDCYDGTARKAFGTGQSRIYKSCFGFIAGVTPVIEKHRIVLAQLGERYLYFRPTQESRREKTRRAISNVGSEGRMRDELIDATLSVLAQSGDSAKISTETKEEIVSLAEFVALSRSSVARDRQGNIQYPPVPEIGTRSAKVLMKLATGISIARGTANIDNDIMRVIRRVALDSIPSNRARLLRTLWEMHTSPHRTDEIAVAMRVPTTTARAWLEDLVALDIAKRIEEARNAHAWQLSSAFAQIVREARVFNNNQPPPTDVAPHGKRPGTTRFDRGVQHHPLSGKQQTCESSAAHRKPRKSTRQRILELLADGKPRSKKTIKESLGGNLRVVTDTIRELVEKGRLTKIGSGMVRDPFLYSLSEQERRIRKQLAASQPVWEHILRTG
jgi:predicted ArsR family transcriptional regulator